MELTAKTVAAGFKAAGERFENVDEQIKCLEETCKTLASQNKQLLKRFGWAIDEGSLDGKPYQSFWPNSSMAKDFGICVMKAAGVFYKDMGTTSATEGGNLISTTLSGWIIQKLGQYGKFRANATTVQMGSGSQLVPKIASDLTIYCPGEGGEITKSDIKIGSVSMVARKFACITAVNRELEEDALAGLGEIVGISITRSMAQKEDLIGFLGDGTSPYFGMKGVVGALMAVDETIANIKSLVVGSGNAYSELTLADFRKVVGTLPAEADDNAKWYMSKKFYYEVVYPLAETAGVANVFEILSDRKGRFLLGYPVEFVSCMPSLEASSQVCAILGDLELGAYLGERREMEIARSDEVLFGNDQIAIRGTERIDVNVYGVGNTDEAGPIVGLITAAA